MIISQQALGSATDATYYHHNSSVSFIESDDPSSPCMPDVISFLVNTRDQDFRKGKRRRTDPSGAWSGCSSLSSTSAASFELLEENTNTEISASVILDVSSDKEDYDVFSEKTVSEKKSDDRISDTLDLIKNEDKEKENKVENKNQNETNKKDENQQEHKEKEEDRYNPDVNYLVKYWLLSISNKVLSSQLDALRKDNSEYSSRLKKLSKHDVCENMKLPNTCKAVSTGMPIEDNVKLYETYNEKLLYRTYTPENISPAISRRQPPKKTPFQLKFTPLRAAPRFYTKTLPNDYQQQNFKFSLTQSRPENLSNHLLMLSENSQSNDPEIITHKQSWQQQNVVDSQQLEWNDNNYTKPYSENSWVLSNQTNGEIDHSSSRRAGPSIFRKSKNNFWKTNFSSHLPPLLNEHNSFKSTYRIPLPAYANLPVIDRTSILPKTYNMNENESWKEEEVALIYSSSDLTKSDFVTQTSYAEKSAMSDISQLSDLSNNFIPSMQNIESNLWSYKDTNIRLMHSAMQDTTSIFASDVALSSRRVDAGGAAWY